MRVVLYARVSTEEQAEKFGLASQLTELRELAARKGYTILDGGEFVDDGHSGADLNRPDLTRLRDAVRTGGIQAILVHDPDRLSRRLVHQLLLADEFERAGVSLEFLTTPKDDTPESRLFLNMKSVIAEWEREKILERTMRGKREAARQGRVVAGPIPYGYRPAPNMPGKLAIHADEAYVVQRMFRWLVDEQYSTRRIVLKLRQLGIRPRRGGLWAFASVRGILQNSLYMGQAYFGRRQRLTNPATGRETLRFRDRSEWIPLTVPAIVTSETFRAAQRQFERNRETTSGRPPTRLYLLRGLLRCGICDRKYAGEPSHGRRTYRCTGRSCLIGENRCHVSMLSADHIEAFVWGAIVQVLKRPGLLAEKLEAHRRALGVRQVEVVSEAEYLARQLADLERQEERLVDLYLDEDLSKSILRKRLDELHRRKADCQARLTEAQRRAAEHEAAEAHHDAVRRYCELALRGLDLLTPEGRQQLLRALVDQILVRDNVLEIHGILPGRWTPPSPWTRRAGNRSESPGIAKPHRSAQAKGASDPLLRGQPWRVAVERHLDSPSGRPQLTVILVDTFHLDKEAGPVRGVAHGLSREPAFERDCRREPQMCQVIWWQAWPSRVQEPEECQEEEQDKGRQARALETEG